MSSRVPTSSPLSSARLSADTLQKASSQSRPQYRPALALPFELLQHVQVYLEENLFSQALRVLLNLISATTANEKAVPVPPPDFLAVISTLTVHPSLTTRAAAPEKLIQANIASRLLWTISKTTGPVNSRLTEAFRFRQYDDRVSACSRIVEDNDEWQNRLTITYADKDSLFSLADDFWAVVGWALNCSCLPGPFAARWSYWLPWLEYMLDSLETDWELREVAGTCDQSLLWQYIKTADGGNGKGRRVLRAVFADGDATSLKEFRAIFPRELKERKQQKGELKKQDVKVDVDEEIYGDWMQESDSTTEGEDATQAAESVGLRPSKRLKTRTPSTRRRITPRASKLSLFTDHEDSEGSVTSDSTKNCGLGPPESISIRLRLLELLSMVSAHQDLIVKNSDTSWPDLHELFTLFVEFVRPLPLTNFQQFVLQSKSKGLSAENRMALCEFLLQRIVDGGYVSKVSTFQPMTVARLVQRYLPYASGKTTIEFQAKVSILLEGLLRQLAKDNNIAPDQKDDLLDALEAGIDTRTAKVKELRGNMRYKKAVNKKEELAVSILEESSMRMRFVVEHLAN